jgi:hypothetical protein
MKSRCEKGHYYSKELPACPYCPQDSTKTVNPQKPIDMNPNDKTKVIGDNHPNDTKTIVNETQNVVQRDFNKTTIVRQEEPNKTESGTAATQTQRKIVGWLISYEQNPNGTDYRLYEGNNTVGREVSNNIVVAYEGSVSAKHALILYKKGQFFIRDEMAANGTFVNDVEIEIGQPIKIKDGDQIRFGKAGFKFRSVE